MTVGFGIFSVLKIKVLIVTCPGGKQQDHLSKWVGLYVGWIGVFPETPFVKVEGGVVSCLLMAVRNNEI